MPRHLLYEIHLRSVFRWRARALVRFERSRRCRRAPVRFQTVSESTKALTRINPDTAAVLGVMLATENA